MYTRLLGSLEYMMLVYETVENICKQGPRKLKKSGGAQAPLSPKNCPQYSKFCVLLHFYATIFKSQGVHVHPVHPLLRGPCRRVNPVQTALKNTQNCRIVAQITIPSDCEPGPFAFL